MGLFVLVLSLLLGHAVAPPDVDGAGGWAYGSRLQEYWEYWRDGMRWQWAANCLLGMCGAVMAAQSLVAVASSGVKDKELRGVLLGVAGYVAALASLWLPPLPLVSEGLSAGLGQWLGRAWCGGWLLEGTGRCEAWLWAAMDRASLVPLAIVSALLAWVGGLLLETKGFVGEKTSPGGSMAGCCGKGGLRNVALPMCWLSKPCFWLIAAAAVLMLSPIFGVDGLPRAAGESEWEYGSRAENFWSGIVRWQYVANGLLWLWAFVAGAQSLVLLGALKLRKELRGIGLGLGVVGCAAAFASVYWPTYSEAHFLAATLSELLRKAWCAGATWAGYGHGCQEAYWMSMLETGLVPFSVVAMLAACASGYLLIRLSR